jgi:TatD DNase family protein
MSVLPPIDARAHVLTTIAERDLRQLRSVVFAVTREPAEWDAAVARQDELCIWGLGAHPQVPAAIAFDVDRLTEAVASTPLIGEVGLDGGSKVPMADQRRVFRAALEVSQQQSRLVTIHSTRASAAVLREIESVGDVPGAILHWWRGSVADTKRAIALGCYFSLNGAEAARPKVIALLQVDRVLTERTSPTPAGPTPQPSSPVPCEQSRARWPTSGGSVLTTSGGSSGRTSPSSAQPRERRT